MDSDFKTYDCQIPEDIHVEHGQPSCPQAYEDKKGAVLLVIIILIFVCMLIMDK